MASLQNFVFLTLFLVEIGLFLPVESFAGLIHQTYCIRRGTGDFALHCGVAVAVRFGALPKEYPFRRSGPTTLVFALRYCASRGLGLALRFRQRAEFLPTLAIAERSASKNSTGYCFPAIPHLAAAILVAASRFGTERLACRPSVSPFFLSKLIILVLNSKKLVAEVRKKYFGKFRRLNFVILSDKKWFFQRSERKADRPSARWLELVGSDLWESRDRCSTCFWGTAEIRGELLKILNTLVVCGLVVPSCSRLGIEGSDLGFLYNQYSWRLESRRRCPNFSCLQWFLVRLIGAEHRGRNGTEIQWSMSAPDSRLSESLQAVVA